MNYRHGVHIKRVWDLAFDDHKAEVIQARRLNPDGLRREVVWDEVLEKYTYPWRQLKDGDFFVAPLRGSKEAMRVLFRQTAHRLNIEVTVAVILVDGQDAFRVTRVLGGVNELKDQFGVKRFNIKRRRAYMTQHARPDNPKPARKPKVKISKPTEPEVGLVQHTDFHEDYAELRRQRLLEARREAAELPDDHPDFMGVQRDE